MKTTSILKRTVTALLILLCSSTAAAQEIRVYDDDSVPMDSATVQQLLAADTLEQPTPRLVTSQMHLMARSYGDSIVLRWAPEDYVSWKYLNRYGYNLLRIGTKGTDTLAYALKPLSLEHMLARYSDPSDSLSAMATELMWGNGRMKYNQTRAIPGTIEAMLELSEEQNMMFGFAVLISEWRRDLAEAMAMRFVDRNVKPGEHYQYVLQPTVWPEDSSIIFRPGYIEDIENTRYTPQPLDISITDSITGPYRLTLEWPMQQYSSFEIERRDSLSSWHRINQNPFVPFLKEDLAQTTALFTDYVENPGTYQYRIQAHDLFGDLTDYSDVHTVTLTDTDPPRPPKLALVYIDRPDDDPSAKILARIYWTKDTLEEDLTGFLPLYYNKPLTGDEWKPLLDDAVTPADSVADRSSLPFLTEEDETSYMCTVDVTNLRTGLIAIAAYDRAGNMMASMPQQLRVEDMKAPDAPQNFQADVKDDGRIILSWSPVDDVDYYQVAFANDTTHMFQILNEGGIRDTTYVDSVALDVNQKYIYYKVRATDYATNEGTWSDILEVQRPTLVPPSVAHLDSAWHDHDGINIRWIVGMEATMSHHLVYRQKKGDNLWTVIRRCDADSLKTLGYELTLFDNPDYDRQRRYRYCVESFNTSGLSSGKSLVYTVLHQGPTLVKADIRLAGNYDKESGEVRLAWETSNIAEKGDYHYSIYRKAPGDEAFRAVTTTQAEPQYQDVLLRPGESAEYYVKIVFKDGRRSRPSNTVSVRRSETP